MPSFQARSAIARYAMPTVVLHDRCSMRWSGANIASTSKSSFSTMMQSCGVCFVHRPEDRTRTIETEYIAPDLLPGRDDVAMDIEAMWRDEAPRGELVVELPFLHPGVFAGSSAGSGTKRASAHCTGNTACVCTKGPLTAAHASSSDRARLPPPGAARSSSAREAARRHGTAGTTQRVDRGRADAIRMPGRETQRANRR